VLLPFNVKVPLPILVSAPLSVRLPPKVTLLPLLSTVAVAPDATSMLWADYRRARLQRALLGILTSPAPSALLLPTCKCRRRSTWFQIR